jgi:hypothetical protein
MKKIGIVLLVVLVSAFMAANVFAASSKTTAATGSVVVVPEITSVGACSPVLSNDIRMANQSDLLIDVSVECGLVTRTRAKSKGGVEDSSAAAAEVKMYVTVDGSVAMPGDVTFCRRAQQLSAKFQGIFEGPIDCYECVDVEGTEVCSYNLQCLADNCLALNDDETAIVIDDACLIDEEVELILDTMNANSFNFVATNVGVGDHTVTAWACTDTCTGTLELDEATGTYTCVAGEVDADARAILGKGSMAVEEVKMVKDDGADSPMP